MGLYDSLIPGNKSTSVAPTSYGIYSDLIPKNQSPVSGAMNFPVSTPAQSAAFAKAAVPPSSYISGTPETSSPGILPTIENAIGSTIKSFGDAVTQGGSNLSDQWDQIFSSHTNALQKGVAVGEAGIGTVNAVFGALLSPLQGLATVPQLGHLVDFTNNVFSAIGQGSGKVATDTLNNVPFVSQSVKDTLHPLVNDAASLAGQILAGHFGAGIFGDFKAKSTEILNTINDTLQENAPVEKPNSTTSLMKIPSPEGTIALSGVETPPAPTESPVAPEPVPGIGEPATPAQTPRIESTATPSPVAEPTSPIPEGAPLSPIASPETPSVTLAEPATSGQIVSTPESRAEAINKPITTGNAPVESQSVTIDNMQQHLSPADFETFKQDTSHEQAKKVEQVQKAQAFVSENPAVADKIIFEGAHPPEGLRTQDVFTEALIKAQADYKAGKIPFEQYYKYVKADELLGSRHGSELGSRANRFEKDNPASWLTKAREAVQKSNIKYKEGETPAKTSKSAVAKEAKTAKATVSKARAKLIDYQKIIDTITC